jgi:hypothetical protein
MAALSRFLLAERAWMQRSSVLVRLELGSAAFMLAERESCTGDVLFGGLSRFHAR